MIATVACEILKLKRSPVLLTALGGPFAAAAFSFLALIAKEGPVPWVEFLRDGIAMWAYLLLPLTITALTVFLAQMEHGARMWTHLLVLPTPRWQLFAAKAVIVAFLIAAMNAVLFILLIALGWLFQSIGSAPLFSDAPQPAWLADLLFRMSLSSLAMGAVQLWAALAIRSFVPPLILGIVGPVAAVGAVASGSALPLPWSLAALTLASPERAAAAVATGPLMAAIIAIVMMLHLSRREWRT